MSALPVSYYQPTLTELIETRSAQIGIIGMGYVGLPLALLYSAKGFPVTGIDIDSNKVRELNRGNSYFATIPARDVRAAIDSRFLATADYSIVAKLDVIIVCVPTPLNDHAEPDLRYITQTAECIAPYMREGQLIVLESTTYPGTTEEVLVPILEKHNRTNLKASRDSQRGPLFYVAFSPEREDPGRTDVVRCDIPKVIGGLDPEASSLAAALYNSVFSRVVQVSSPAVAEMTKLLENVYRCVNIAMVNELKQLCLRIGIDVWEVIEAAKTKPFGFQAFYPGPGLGGHCIPVDPFYLAWKARQYDFATRFIELAGQINSEMPYHVVRSTADALNVRKKSLNGSRVLVLGVAYKKDVDDLRESPALTIIELLRNQGAEVSYNDPLCSFVDRGRKYNLQMASVPLDGLAQYDCVLIVTDHSSYNYGRIVRESQLVVDTRNATRGITAENIVRC